MILTGALCLAPVNASALVRGGGTAATPPLFNGPNGPEARWVIDENEKRGTTAWQITTPQTATGIMGYANLVQAKIGQRVMVYVSTQAPTFQLQAFRMGYYQGKGARLVWHSKTLKGYVQPPVQLPRVSIWSSARGQPPSPSPSPPGGSKGSIS